MNHQRQSKRQPKTKPESRRNHVPGSLYRWAVTVCALVLFGAVLLKNTNLLKTFRYQDTMEAAGFTEQELISLMDREDAVLCYQPEPGSLRELDADWYYVDNMVLVYMEPDATRQEKLDIIQAAQGELAGLDNVSGCLQIRVSPRSREELTALCQSLSGQDGVWDAVFDIAMPAGPEKSQIPDDPFDEWGGCDWQGEMNQNNWAWEAIDAPKAWAYADELEEVSVGVIDNGFWGVMRHEDTEIDYTYYDYSEGVMPLIDGKTFDGADLIGLHGLEVVSVMAAEADNGKGLAGIGRNISHLYFTNFLPRNLEYVGADDPDSNFLENIQYTWIGRIESCISKLLAPKEADPLDLMVAFFQREEAKEGDQKTKLINISQGYGGEAGQLTQELIDLWGSRLSGYLYQALVTGKMRNPSFDFLIIQSAGNGVDNQMVTPQDSIYKGLFAAVTEENCCSPSPQTGYSKDDILNRILVAGAAARRENEDGTCRIIADPGASYGATVDILAPAREILCAKIETNPLNLNTIRSCYSLVDGTSFSAPLVTGTAAMVWGANPKLTGPEVKAVLEESASLTLSAPDYQGMFRDENGNLYEYPVLNAGSAVAMALSYEELPSAPDETSPSSSAPVIVETIPPDVPKEEPSPEELFMEKLAQLADEYGVIPLCPNDVFRSDSPYGGGDVLVPASRFTGLLGADLWDYDQDGVTELLTIRAEPRSDYPLGSVGETGVTEPEIPLYLSIYEADTAEGSVLLSDERDLAILGLADSSHYASIQFMRGEQNGRPILYVDYFLNLNSQGFGILGLTYENGSFHVAGGADCSEFYAYATCCRAVSDEALHTLLGRQINMEESGWEQGTIYNWEESGTDEAPAEYLEGYRLEYESALASLGLRDLAPRSIILNSASGMEQIRQYCVLKPLDHYQSESGQLTALCGILSPRESGTVILTCYDEAGYLAPFR